MNTLDLLFVTGVVIAFVSGVRSTFRLWRRYNSVASLLTDPRERLVLRSFVIVSVVITAAAGFYGFVSARRLLGYDSFDWTPVISVAVAIVVLLIPTMLDLVITRVARR